MMSRQPPWKVLVLFGPSGVGKSTAAAEIARRTGTTWLQVDDLRLTLQFSDASLPARTEDLYYFERTPGIWRRPVDELRQGFINVAEVMASAVRTIIHSHVVTDAPMVIEGDGILPSLVDDPLLRPLVDAGVIRVSCVATPGVDALFENLVGRGRGIEVNEPEKHRIQAGANHAFGVWLEQEARRLGIPVVTPLPFTSLPDRVMEAIGT